LSGHCSKAPGFAGGYLLPLPLKFGQFGVHFGHEGFAIGDFALSQRPNTLEL
jgi:hypothetical protein